MSKQNTSRFFKSVKASLSKHSPEILTGIGIAGMITATIFAVKATPKAMTLIEKRKEEINDKRMTDIQETTGDMRNYNEITKLGLGDTIKATWKCYIPTVVTASVSIACLIGASSVKSKRNAVLATAYQLSETALAEYREKVVETIGEKKEAAIRDKVNKERLEKNPVKNNEVIVTAKGNTLCYDHMTGRYFTSDIDKINKAVNEINNRILHEYYASVNDLYSELGLYHTSLGEKMGWNSDMGLLEVSFSAQVADDGNPCLVLDFNHPPKYDFDRFV